LSAHPRVVVRQGIRNILANSTRKEISMGLPRRRSLAALLTPISFAAPPLSASHADDRVKDPSKVFDAKF